MSTPVSHVPEVSRDELARVCAAVSEECWAFGGNCGVFAIALKRVLGGGSYVAVCHPIDDDLGPFYHVAYLAVDGGMFDGSGELSREGLAEWVWRYKDEFPDGECPDIEAVDLSVRPDPEGDIIESTSFTESIAAFEALIRRHLAVRSPGL